MPVRAHAIRDYFRSLKNVLRQTSLKRSIVRRQSRHGFGQVIESVEQRLYLSAVAIQTVAAEVSNPTTTVHVGTEGSLYFRTGNPQDAAAMHGLGGVALEGGGTDVDQTFQWMAGRMGGKGDFLVVRADVSSGYNSYIYDMGGSNSVSTLVIPNRAAAMDPAVQKIILTADAVFIAGGSQNNYLDWWKGTPVQIAINADIAHGVPIGGTSAGTDIIGQFINSADFDSIRSPQALADPFDANMTFDQSFVSPNLLPFLNNTLLDTHFENRNRQGRMVAFLARVDTNGWSANRKPMGIGIDQETVLEILPNGQATIAGNPNVTRPQGVEFFETPGLPQVARPGQPLTYATLNVDRVAIGGTFNLGNWSSSFPINNSFTSHLTASVTKGVLMLTGPPALAITHSIASTPEAVDTGLHATNTEPTSVTTHISPSAQSTFAPSAFADSYNSIPGTVVSLRDAVVAANNSTASETVTINLKSGTYSLSLPQGGAEDGTNGDLIVSSSKHTLVINGSGTSGSGATMIDASMLDDRILQMAAGTTVILQNLILTGGIARDGGVAGAGAARGGAVLDQGESLTLNNVWVVGNRALGSPTEDAQGGGIYSSGGKLAIYRSLIATNTASGGSSGSNGDGKNGGNGQGGGLYAAAGSITLGTVNSPDKFESNRAVGGSGSSGDIGGNGGNAQGGGIYVGGGALALTLNMSHALFASNVALAGSGARGTKGDGVGGNAQGAGLYVKKGSFSISVTSNFDSFQSNRASGGTGAGNAAGGNAQGAGIYLSGGAISLFHDAFSKNVALGGTGGSGGTAQGGAIFDAGTSLRSTESNFSKNVALGGACTTSGGSETGGLGQGGGLYAMTGSVTLVRNNFVSNSARGGSAGDGDGSSPGGAGSLGAGGGIFANGNTIILSSIRDHLSSNLAAGGRGGNGASGVGGGLGIGGGAFFSVKSLYVKSDVVDFNQALGGTGGMSTAGLEGGMGGTGAGGGLYVNRDSIPSAVSLIADRIRENEATGGTGGGVITGGVGGKGGAASGGGVLLSQVPLSAIVRGSIRLNVVAGGRGGLGGTNGLSGVATGAVEFVSPSPFVIVH